MPESSRFPLLSICLFVIVTLTLTYGQYIPNCDFDSGCELPECNCNYYDIPGGLPRYDTPQMILFSYTGALTRSVRDMIIELFPDKLRNPNKCSAGITIFLVSQGSDVCGVHRTYFRGHEIALAGTSRTEPVDELNETDWFSWIVDQQALVSERSRIDLDNLIGMKAQKLSPGGDKQFKVIETAAFQYDASLAVFPKNNITPETLHFMWPFTLNRTLDEIGLRCSNKEDCPSVRYPDIWEVPVRSFDGTRMGKSRRCTYLDDCLTDLKSADDVKQFLKRHFFYSYNGNRAPLQIHLQARTLQFKMATEGIKKFLQFVITKSDTWILTYQEALKWVQKPTLQSMIIDNGIWDCAKPGEYWRCTIQDGGNVTSRRVTFREIMNVEEIWIWQTVFLIVLYIVIYRYDKDQATKKKK